MVSMTKTCIDVKIFTHEPAFSFLYFVLLFETAGEKVERK